MKPVIIYTLPRTRSSALLEACKRDVLLREPLDRRLDDATWEKLKTSLNSSDTCSKFFGSQVSSDPRAKAWFRGVSDTHDVFILMRDLNEVCYSFLLAKNFGWGKVTEVEPSEIKITYDDILSLHFEFERFFQMLPIGGQIISFETAPSSHFDFSRITLENQHSLEKIPRLANQEAAKNVVSSINRIYGLAWAELWQRASANNGGVGERFIPPLC